MTTMTYTGTLEVLDCAGCHMEFGIPRHLEAELRRDHKTFYCPKGHSNYFPGESDLEKAERFRKNAARRSEMAEARASALADQLQASERSRAAQKGVATRMKNRIAAGVCPCCNRRFENVARHMAGQHPNFAQKDEK